MEGNLGGDLNSMMAQLNQLKGQTESIGKATEKYNSQLINNQDG